VAASKAFLALLPPCAERLRQNFVTAATLFDHVIPRHGARKLFGDRHKAAAALRRLPQQENRRRRIAVRAHQRLGNPGEQTVEGIPGLISPFFRSETGGRVTFCRARFRRIFFLEVRICKGH